VPKKKKKPNTVGKLRPHVNNESTSCVRTHGNEHNMCVEHGKIGRHVKTWKRQYIKRHVKTWKRKYIQAGRHVKTWKRQYIKRHVRTWKRKYIYRTSCEDMETSKKICGRCQEARSTCHGTWNATKSFDTKLDRQL